MLHQISEKCTRVLIHNHIISSEEIELYTYGFEQVISTSLILVSIFIISALMHNIWFGLLFTICFSPLRVFIGGFHCETYAKCFFFSNGVFLVSVFLTKVLMLLPAAFTLFINIVILLLCNILVYRFAPIQHPNHLLSPKRAVRNKRKARILVIVQCSILIVGNLICFVGQIDMTLIELSVVSTALSVNFMMVAKLHTKGGKS